MQTLKLPVEMPDHIEQYIRSDFLLEYPDWISMWSPSQGCKAEPVPIPRRSVGLGDVGYFDKTGRFEILFNIYLSRETNLKHGYQPPKNFIHYSVGPCEEQWGHLNLEKSSNRRLLSGDLEISRGEHVGGHGTLVITLSSPKTKDPVRGTALILPDAMVRTTILPSAQEEMQGYFDQHAREWYKFCRAHENKKVRETKNGSLLLVTSCYKAKTWAMATFNKRRSSKKQEVRLSLYKSDPNADIYAWEVEGSVLARTGPAQEEMMNGLAIDANQCVAVELCALVEKSIVRGVPASLHSIMSTISRTSRFSVASTIRKFQPMR
ncbi:hypothetical protein CVT26_002639 [Gymnopilus dilepis]|uniref:Uncharacterized protein n=1 Tax=Gymnopilus dilepis TaxID=231916 RepID=A0A409VEZ8_9AGAR|nr:hypothetical protein CVT26_002639 [Gymnopilus dilepis]